jgi:flagellar protein FliO/FliZ
MAGSMAIRWTSAARFAGLGLAAIAALGLLANAVEPPAPPPVPPDVGLGPSVSTPDTPAPAGEGRDGGAEEPSRPGRKGLRPLMEGPGQRAENRPKARRPRPAQRHARPDQEPPAADAPTTVPASPPEAAPAPIPVPTPAVAAPPPAAPAAPPPPPPAPEFGFER